MRIHDSQPGAQPGQWQGGAIARRTGLALSVFLGLGLACDGREASPEGPASEPSPVSAADEKTSQDPPSPSSKSSSGGAQDSPDPQEVAPALPAPAQEHFEAPRARIEDERNSIEVFRRVAPSTVFVTQQKRVVDRWSGRFQELPAGSGSGFLWDDQGHVVTNFHVIDGANSLTVSLHEGKTFPAKLVGGDRTKDLAVLKLEGIEGIKLEAVGLPPENESLAVGQKTLAIGNPFGLDSTLTTGVVSALGREVKGFGGVTIRDMVQTDASINPGNSGGPLLNSRGELIGVNTMIFSKSGSSAGIGFAVPVSTVRKIVPQILRYGAPLRAGLGLRVVPDSISQRNGIRGVVIEQVPAGSPAAKAGLRGLQRTRYGTALGDVIVGIDGAPVRNYDDLFTALDKHAPGDEVKVRVQSENSSRELLLQLSRVRGR